MSHRKVNPVRAVKPARRRTIIVCYSNYRAWKAAVDFRNLLRRRDRAKKRSARGPAAPPTRTTVVRPTVEVETKPVDSVLELPLYVTLAPGATKERAALEELVEQAGRYFKPARLRFKILDPCRAEGTLPPGVDCPFHGDLDHTEEWLHLLLVPDEEALQFSCGRCFTLPDSASAHVLAQTLGKVLGLEPVPQIGFEERLMSGRGAKLSVKECLWLRAQAGQMMGDSYSLPLITVPLWGYPVDSPESLRSKRSRQEFASMLEGANRIWQQAGIEFQLEAWCALGGNDLSEDVDLEGDAWAGLVRHAPQALHCFFLQEPTNSWHLSPEPDSGLVLISDALRKGRGRGLAQGLGILLGLEPVSGPDQLLCQEGIGRRLSSTEVRRARNVAVELRYKRLESEPEASSTVEVVAAPVIKVVKVPLRVHLGRNISAEQASDWMRKVGDIFAPVPVELQVTFHTWTEPESLLEFPGADQSNLERVWQPMRGAPDYQAWALNVFLVDEIRTPAGRHSYVLCPFFNALLVGRLFGRHTPVKQVALALAAFWGLGLETDGPYYRLMNWNGTGVRLSPSEITKLTSRFQPRRPLISSRESVVRIPVILSVVNRAFGLEPSDLAAIWPEVNRIWSQAGIEWQPVDSRHIRLTEQQLETFRPDIWTHFDIGADPSVCHALVVEEIRAPDDPRQYSMKVFPRAVAVTATLGAVPLDLRLARGLAALLGLTLRSEGDVLLLTTHLRDGYKLLTEEVAQARAAAAQLGGQWQVEPFEGEQMAVPVSVLIVNQAGGLISTTFRSIWNEVQTIWSQAGLNLPLTDCREIALEEEALERLQGGDLTDISEQSGALSLVLVAGLPIPEKSHHYLQRDAQARRTTTINVAFAQTPIVLCLARALAQFLGLTLGSSEPDRLTTHYQTGCKLAETEIRFARKMAAQLIEGLEPGGDLESLPPGSPEIECSVQLYIRPGTTIRPESIALMEEGASIWRRAGIRITFLPRKMIMISDQDLQTSFDQSEETHRLGPLGKKLWGPQARLHLLLLDTPEICCGTTRYNSLGYGPPGNGVVRIRDDSSKRYAVVLGMMMGAKWGRYFDDNLLMGPGNGFDLTARDVYRARSYLMGR